MRAALVLAALLAACGGPASGGATPTPAVPDGVRVAPDAVAVDGRVYTLQVDLFRDVMPGPAPTPRRGIGGTIFLRADVESSAPAGMRAGRAWLFNGPEVWETVPQPLQTLVADRRFHLSLGIGAGKREGPVWAVGAKVDVVLEFFVGDRAYFIQQRGVEVIGAA